MKGVGCGHVEGDLVKIKDEIFQDRNNVDRAADKVIEIVDRCPIVKTEEKTRDVLRRITEGIYSVKNLLSEKKEKAMAALFYEVHDITPTKVSGLMDKTDPASTINETKGIIRGKQEHPVPSVFLQDEKMPCNKYFKSICVNLSDGSSVSVSQGFIAYHSHRVKEMLETSTKKSLNLQLDFNKHQFDTFMAFLETLQKTLINDENVLPLMRAAIDLHIPNLMSECFQYVLNTDNDEQMIEMLNIIGDEIDDLQVSRLENQISQHIKDAIIKKDLGRLEYYRNNLKREICLNLWGTKELTDDDLKSLEGLPLRELDISKCEKLTNDCLITINEMKSVTGLLLGTNSWVDDETLKQIPSHIGKLSLVTCKEFTKSGLEYLQNRSIRELDLSGCRHLEDTDYTSLPNNLTKLNMRMCRNVREKAMRRIGEMEGLVHLVLAGTVANDKRLSYLPQSLEVLDLSGCVRVSNDGVKSLSKRPLKELYLSGLKKLTDDCLTDLPCDLSRLGLNSCINLTDGGMDSLSNMPNLKSVSLLRCPNITENGVNKFSERVQVRWQPPQESARFRRMMAAYPVFLTS